MSEQETDLGDIQPNPVFLSRYALQIWTQRQGEKSHEPKAYVPQEVTKLLLHPSPLTLSPCSLTPRERPTQRPALYTRSK